MHLIWDQSSPYLTTATLLLQINQVLSTKHSALTCTCSSDSLSTPDAWPAATPRPESPEPLERPLPPLRLLWRPDERLLLRLLWPAGDRIAVHVYEC